MDLALKVINKYDELDGIGQFLDFKKGGTILVQKMQPEHLNICTQIVDHQFQPNVTGERNLYPGDRHSISSESQIQSSDFTNFHFVTLTL